jgi:hypothetical protein
MKSHIVHKPRTIVRIVTSLVLQIPLVVLLRQHHPDSTVFTLGILVIAGLAMVPLCIWISRLNARTSVILGLVGLFPQVVILVTLLHLLGFKVLFTWLVERLQF